jgi:hypothetical protein
MGRAASKASGTGYGGYGRELADNLLAAEDAAPTLDLDPDDPPRDLARRAGTNLVIPAASSVS